MLVIGKFVHCNRKKSLIVSDNTIPAERLVNSFQNLGRSSAKTGQELAAKLKGNPQRALEIGAKIDSSAKSKNLKAALSNVHEVKNFLSNG